MKIGIFGGTFNPPHNGHRHLVLEFKKKFKFDKILIIPTFQPPHKQAKDLISTEDRLLLCRECFHEDFFTISDIEIQREGKSFTVHTLQQLHEIYVDSEFYLIIGSDMLLSFHEWFQFEEILRLSNLCVATRKERISKLELETYVKENLSSINGRNEIIVIDTKPFECSSTGIREKLKKGEDVSEYLNENVLEIVEEKGLWNG